MRYAIIALMSMALLCGCETAASKAESAYTASQALTYPDVPVYTKSQLDQAAAELQRCSLFVICQMMIPDYLTMRDQTRVAIQAKRQP